MDLDFIRKLDPDRETRTSDESIAFEWFSSHRLIDVYDNGVVVVIGADPCPEIPDREAYCEVTIEDREWLENFVKYGWSDENPSFKNG